MKKKRSKKYLLLGLILFALIIAVSAALANNKVQSIRRQDDIGTISMPPEAISDEPVPMSAPQTETDEETLVVPIAIEETIQNAPVTVQAIQTGSRENPAPAQQPAAPASEPAAPSGGSTPPSTESEITSPTESAPMPLPAEETSEPTPTPTATPVKAQKPDDITNVTAMARYLFDAASEFWAVEKDFSGTTTRPVSTRVASSIGAGTAVDCPGGDTVRIDKDGVSHDSYAIADHFRDYVDMPDLQYFKIYLSEKENPNGAREDVIGSYYQYGSDRATYMAEEGEGED